MQNHYREDQKARLCDGTLTDPDDGRNDQYNADDLTKGSTGVDAWTWRGSSFCARNPNASGKTMTCGMPTNIAQALTGRYWLANIQTRKGVKIGAASDA